jgi:hypothetical protein
MDNFGPVRAQNTIETYEADNAIRYRGEGRETVLYDLITDVLLWAKSEGLDADSILDNATEAYEAEKLEVAA